MYHGHGNGFSTKIRCKGHSPFEATLSYRRKTECEKDVAAFMLRSDAAFFPTVGFGYFHHYCQVCEPAFFSP
jgi:hypothetical protein